MPQVTIESLVMTAKEAYPRLRRTLIYILVVALAVSSLIPIPGFKVTVLSGLGVTLLFLIFDLYNELTRRLAAIEANVGSPHPPTYENFSEVQSFIVSHIAAILESGSDLYIEIIGVSARFSWRMVEDNLSALLKKYEKSKIKIDVVVSTRETLVSWNLDRWIVDLDRTISGMNLFPKENAAEIEAGRLTIKRYDYDNIPQWHGVMLNGKVLFMGRTEWIFRSFDYPDLKVGQCKYRLYQSVDRYGGETRIKMFANWIERFRQRHEQLTKESESKQSVETIETPT